MSVQPSQSGDTFEFQSWRCVRCGHLGFEHSPTPQRAEEAARWHQDRYGEKHSVRLWRLVYEEELRAPSDR